MPLPLPGRILSAATPDCPLCRTTGCGHRLTVQDRVYHACRACDLVFLDPALRLDARAERARYETHQNDPCDPGYRRFLDRLAAPLGERLAPGASGLDYGSGPGPTLSVMLEERGFPMSVYDPFFAPDDRVLARTWDFVTCTETVEHFHEPALEFERLRTLVRPGGWIAIMTEWLPEGGEDRPEYDAFAGWYYIRDPTHVCFYRPATFRWIAAQWGWMVDFPRRNVAFLRAPAHPGEART